jgi:hypothetical protein
MPNRACKRGKHIKATFIFERGMNLKARITKYAFEAL